MNVEQINSILEKNGLASIVDKASPREGGIVLIHVVNQNEIASENFRKMYPAEEGYNNVFNVPVNTV